MDAQILIKMRDIAVKAIPLIMGALKQKDENGKSMLDKLYDKIKEKSKEFGKVLTEEGLREALSYKERSFDSIDFKTVVSLVKKAYKLESGWRVCVLKTNGEIKQLDILVYDDKDNVVISPECPWVHVNASELESDIIDLFGNKSMLILQ